MKALVIPSISLCLLFVSSKQVSAQQCQNLTGDYSYLGGRGYARVTEHNGNVIMTLRWETGDEYLIRADRNGRQLIGDWALLRIGGAEVTPVFRRYVGQVNLDCSIVGIGSDDPNRNNIDGVTLQRR
jgi:hypothetical protein